VLNRHLGELRKFKPDGIALISHSSHPFFALNVLSDQIDLRGVPILVHCYGDFPMQFQWMRNANRKWRGLDIRFVVASRASLELHTRILNHKKALSICPFPVDETVFHWGPASNSASFQLVYTGRLSIQKNVVELVRAVSDWSRQREILTCLKLVGDFDLTAAHFFSKSLAPSLYPSAVLAEGQGNPFLTVEWQPTVPKSELPSLYQHSDAFISLSMHHDEDFGMSPAEALCTGLPCILSSWGGFHDFYQMAQAQGEPLVALWPLRTDVGGVYLDLHDGFLALDKIFQLKSRSSEERKSSSFKFINSFSVAAVANRIEEILQMESEPFEGFDLKTGEKIFSFHHHIRADKFSFRDPFYRDLYQGYFGEKF
jgi:glycosyltransferase involved in cell wall biosynthesis